MSEIETMMRENQILRQKIDEFKRQRINPKNIDGEIKKFVEESQKNINDMTEKVNNENAQRGTKLHALTVEYQGLLKKQIELLTQNKQLSSKKENQDSIFNENIEKLTQEYQKKIKDFEVKVKANVKRIQEMSGTNIIKRLLKNDKFKQQMIKRGVKVDVLEKQSKLEDISNQVEQKQGQITEMQTKSSQLDEEVTKMRELIDTMKDLLENMVKEKENIVKQNVILKQKLKQSQELIGKLLGQNMGDDQNYQDDFEGEDANKGDEDS